MFKRQNRLPRGVGFYNAIFFSTPQFDLKVRGNGLVLNRFGIIVPKKIDKRSTVRNKIKRIFRDNLTELNKDLTIGNDMLFVAKREVIGKNKEQINFLITEALRKLNIKK